MGFLLDRFDPDWKARLETDDSATLEGLLDSAVQGMGSAKAEFTPAELVEAEALARMDVLSRADERRKAERTYIGRLGYRIELVPVDGGLRFEMFDPFSIEALGERRILHWAPVSCRKGTGSVQTLMRPCLTEVDERGRIVRLALAGIRWKPKFAAGWNAPLRMDAEGVRIELEKGRVSYRGNVIIIEVAD